MGSDHHRVPRRQASRVLGLPDTPAGQILHHVGVVDQVSQHPASAGLLPGLCRQLHRPLHAVAESGALGQKDLHRASFPRA